MQARWKENKQTEEKKKKTWREETYVGRVEEQREEVGGVGRIHNKSQPCSTSKDQYISAEETVKLKAA